MTEIKTQNSIWTHWIKFTYKKNTQKNCKQHEKLSVYLKKFVFHTLSASQLSAVPFFIIRVVSEYCAKCPLKIFRWYGRIYAYREYPFFSTCEMRRFEIVLALQFFFSIYFNPYILVFFSAVYPFLLRFC